MDAKNDKVRYTALKLIYMYVSQVHSHRCYIITASVTEIQTVLGHNNKYHCFSGNRSCQFPSA